MAVLLGTVFVASLIGSLHCLGMCGPFALIAGSPGPKQKSAIGLVAAYNVGRLISYTVVGVIFGATGQLINQAFPIFIWQQTATWLAGFLMLLVGLVALVRSFGYSLGSWKPLSFISRWLQSGFSRANTLPKFYRALAIGGISSLMPCGWLYTFAITAAGTGDPAWGGLLMATFWLGTLPIMVALVVGFQRLSQSVQKRVPFAMSTLVIATGLFVMLHRAPVSLEGIDSTPQSKSLVQQILDTDQSQLPCCRDHQ